mgnify:CR=1 FL=1
MSTSTVLKSESMVKIVRVISNSWIQPIFNYALPETDIHRDPFRDPIPNPVLREMVNKNPEKAKY